MSSLKPLIIHSHRSGPNPWKVAIILDELGVPYEHEFTDMADMKKEPFLSLNPNGRSPALTDPNANITLFESGAIIDYLIDRYDQEGKLSYTSFPEKYLTKSWEHFQMSGQGPYFGQKAWFKFYHKEQLPSAIERYGNEVGRVTSVIDSHLIKQGTPYLVGDKCTYADLMFVPWCLLTDWMAPEVDLSHYKAYNAWFTRMKERPATAKVIRDREAAREG